MSEPSTALVRAPSHLVARRAWLSLGGRVWRFYGPDGALRAYVKQKAFRLREEIVVYEDEDQRRPALRVRARQMLDLSATYDVSDARTGEVVGSLRRRGLRSMLRDEWAILGPGDHELGVVQEDSVAMALLRRFLAGFVPQTFHATISDQPVATIAQRFFGRAVEVDFSADSGGLLDRRVGLAMVVLLILVEGRQG